MSTLKLNKLNLAPSLISALNKSINVIDTENYQSWSETASIKFDGLDQYTTPEQLFTIENPVGMVIPNRRVGHAIDMIKNLATGSPIFSATRNSCEKGESKVYLLENEFAAYLAPSHLNFYNIIGNVITDENKIADLLKFIASNKKDVDRVAIEEYGVCHRICTHKLGETSCFSYQQGMGEKYSLNVIFMANGDVVDTQIDREGEGEFVSLDLNEHFSINSKRNASSMLDEICEELLNTRKTA